jgi:(methylthio)acryloyl-CoA hydratase
MTEPLISYQLEGSVALLGLNRPDKRNAINEAMISALRDAVVCAHEEADVAILFGHGSNFSAGLDLHEALARASGQSGPPRKRRPHTWHTVFDLIQRGPIPWVCALHGAVLGGGLELAAATHVRVADQTAFFGLPEGQRGIFVGGGGTVRIQRIIGTTVMIDLMLTGRLLSVAEAMQVQIVRYQTAKGDALTKARELAQKIAQNNTETNWKIINVLPRVNDLSHDDGLFMEYMNSAMARPPQAAQRLRDFVEGRAEPLRPPTSDTAPPTPAKE